MSAFSNEEAKDKIDKINELQKKWIEKNYSMK